MGNPKRVLLHVDSSPMGQASISRHLTREFVQRWRSANPQGEVITRDLTTIAIPVIDAAWVAANYTPRELRTQQQNEILALSTELTGELLDADEYAIGVPMHNWGPSSSFKLWVDQIVRFGETIAITPSGMNGTLDTKRATFFIAAGRHYGPPSADALRNHLEPWLRTFFGSLGVRDMRFVFADGTAEVRKGMIGRAAFLAPHVDAVQSLFPGN
ncbi:MAG: NAD(P)H-dependent oxidoreductase [Candidatus Sulfopaludibacter sp.]|nr:NAD(P)H-dependent oxidoreductase [Candidatus Sulfopaludibacter sp.]